MWKGMHARTGDLELLTASQFEAAEEGLLARDLHSLAFTELIYLFM